MEKEKTYQGFWFSVFIKSILHIDNHTLVLHFKK